MTKNDWFYQFSEMHDRTAWRMKVPTNQITNIKGIFKQFDEWESEVFLYIFRVPVADRECIKLALIDISLPLLITW